MENIKLKGSKNIRDLGGIKTSDGKTVKPHMLLRGGVLNKLTDEDLAVLTNEYNLKTVIDLRTDIEAEEKPDRIPQGVKREHILIFDDAAAGITHEKGTSKTALLDNLPDMSAMYRMMATDDFTVAQFAKVIKTVLESDGTVLFHCTEGKDRTGLTAFFLLTILGVPFETAFEDYLFTNTVAEKRGRKYKRLVRFIRSSEIADTVYHAFRAEKEFLQSAVDGINEKYGSMDAFLRDGLLVTDEMREKFRNKYLI